jgi:hypothetical protein
MAYPFTGMGEGLPSHFQQITLTHLLSLPVETRVSFEPFADKLIQEAGLEWTSEDPTFHQMALHGAVGRMVIDILTKFQAMEAEYQDEPLGKGTIRKLAAFQVTPFGRDLLASLAA